jgi:pimeloyl-ACP methyl ester carboxylesterase
MERTAVNGVELAYEERGDGPAVLLVHGLGGSAYGWRAQLGALGERYRAIAIDQRGAGRSGKPPGPYSIELWVDDLAAVLHALGIERVALVGHSAGCMIVERAAVALGDRVWALAMCGGRLRWPPEAGAAFEQRAELARAGRLDQVAEAVVAGALTERCRRDDPVLTGLMLELIASNDPDAYAAWALAVSEAKMTDPGSVRCPALAFAGSEDVVTPPDAAAEVAAAMPTAETATIADAAHWCMLEQPGAVSYALLSFLDRHAERLNG